jgi:hypothetical protein
MFQQCMVVITEADVRSMRTRNPLGKTPSTTNKPCSFLLFMHLCILSAYEPVHMTGAHVAIILLITALSMGRNEYFYEYSMWISLLIESAHCYPWDGGRGWRLASS